MAVPASRAELLAAITTTFEKLSRDLDLVPPERAREPGMPGHAAGTTMSACDLVAYLVGWVEQVLEWHDRRGRRLADEFPAQGYQWNQLGDLAQHFYAQGADLSWHELRQRLVTANANVIALVEGLSDEELYGTEWYRTWTAGRMISLNTSSPYANARSRLRRWLREQS